MELSPPIIGIPGHSKQNVEILTPLRSGIATSRASLAKLTGLSPTTVAARVDELLAQGHIVETGPGSSRGGRRPRSLEMRADAGVIGCIDLGVDGCSLGLVDFAGELVAERELVLSIDVGPRAVLSAAVSALIELLELTPLPLRGVSVGVPGPVSSGAKIVGPTRMPGWNGVSAADHIHRQLRVPVIVNNDANLMAAGELLDGDSVTRYPNQVFVKIGSGIGCGIVAGGVLYSGSGGVAGDISHVSVANATLPPDATPCSCGRADCLDSLASGNALVREMQRGGFDVRSIDDMIDLARDAHPQASNLLRDAGAITGGVLATIVNFFTPDRVVLGGVLSGSDIFVSGVRSTLYAECLPMATENLQIEISSRGATGGLYGAGRMFLDRAFSVDGIPATVG